MTASEDHAGVVGGLVEALLEHLAGLLGKGGEVAEEAQAHVLLVEQRQLVHERGREEVHEQIDLVLRPLPVLSRERVDGQHVKAEADARRDRLAQRVDAGDMALAAVEPAGSGPAAVAVHDDRDVLGHAGHVHVIERDVLGSFGKVLLEQVFVVAQARSP